MVHPVGFEPTTLGSEDRCSNPLSYGRKFIIRIDNLNVLTATTKKGERRDSNPRSPGPQPGALSLSATPTTQRTF